MRNHTLYLTDIVQAIDSIMCFTQGMNPDTFVDDGKTASAVMRKLEAIISRMSTSTGSEHGEPVVA